MKSRLGLENNLIS